MGGPRIGYWPECWNDETDWVDGPVFSIPQLVLATLRPSSALFV